MRDSNAAPLHGVCSAGAYLKKMGQEEADGRELVGKGPRKHMMLLEPGGIRVELIIVDGE